MRNFARMPTERTTVASERLGGPGGAKPHGRMTIWLFLASDALLFAALFSAYFMRRAGATEPWHPFRDHLGVASINTIVLLGAGVTLTLALRAARRNDARSFRRLLQLSGWLALVFIAVRMDEYGDLLGHRLRPSTSGQLAMYFLLTGVHVLHVTGGALAIAWIGLGLRDGWESSAARIINRVEAVTLYWYFVDLVWLVIVVLLYVV